MTNGPSATRMQDQAHCWVLAEAQSHSIGSIHYGGAAEDKIRMIWGNCLDQKWGLYFRLKNTYLSEPHPDKPMQVDCI